MNKFLFLSLLALSSIALTLTAPATISLAAESDEQREMIDGVVQKVDVSVPNITLKHGPIKSLGMEQGMTMVFAVKDSRVLKDIKAGDKVKFQPERINGQFTVTKIDKAG